MKRSKLLSLPVPLAVTLLSVAAVAILDRVKKKLKASGSSRVATAGSIQCIEDFAVVPPRPSNAQRREVQAKGLSYMRDDTKVHLFVLDHAVTMSLVPIPRKGGWRFEPLLPREPPPSTFIWPPEEEFYLCWADYPNGLEIGVLGKNDVRRDDVKVTLRSNHLRLQIGELSWRNSWKFGGQPCTSVKIYLTKAQSGWWWKSPLKHGSWLPPINFLLPDLEPIRKLDVGSHRGSYALPRPHKGGWGI